MGKLKTWSLPTPTTIATAPPDSAARPPPAPLGALPLLRTKRSCGRLMWGMLSYLYRCGPYCHTVDHLHLPLLASPILLGHHLDFCMAGASSSAFPTLTCTPSYLPMPLPSTSACMQTNPERSLQHVHLSRSDHRHLPSPSAPNSTYTRADPPLLPQSPT